MIRIVFPLLLLASGAGAAEAPPTDLAERLAACHACHGEQGEGRGGSAYVPHLAGKPAGYLLDQLQAFRDGRRVNPQMGWLMRNMDDGYLREIAVHYAAFAPRTAGAAIAAGAIDEARARALIEQGDPAREVPACASCHGANLAGREPGVPGLLGLPADYVVAQLGAWRTRVRRARAPDCMADVARALAPADMRIVGEWLARQSHADAPRPAPAEAFALPRDCGSAAGTAP